MAPASEHFQGYASSASEVRYPVVCIDDDPDDLFFITRRINKAGVHNAVMTFNDGDDAVRHFQRLCENKLFDAPACVIFCDIKMPRLDGFEVLRWFRRQPKLSALNFVMLSGSNEPVDRERAHALGANDYVVKFPPEERFARLIQAANHAVRLNFRPA